MHEVVCNTRYRGGHAAIRNDRDFFDLAMMLANELQMSDERAEVLPAGKLARLDKHAAQRALADQVGIDLARQRRKVRRLERTCGFQHEDSIIESQIVIQHASPL